MITPITLAAAFGLDLALGDPRWLPHPVRIIGHGISRGEWVLRRMCATPRGERFAGMLLVLFIVSATFALTFFIERVLTGFSSLLLMTLCFVILVVLTATTLALRELVNAGQAVIAAVRADDIVKARRELSLIVGRDTENLSEEGILKATIETLAENLSDGVIAPLFYLIIGGLPLAMAYKAINTLDSMIGYKNERYRSFGWAAARLDDVANFIPARITGLLIAVATGLVSLRNGAREVIARTSNAWKVMLRDGRKHPSPNSGIPEAAMAGGLGVQLGGPSAYSGIMVEKAYIGEMREGDYLSASLDAVMIVKAASFLGAALGIVVLIRGLG